MKIILANPRGFCAGVDRAIDIVDRALELFGAPIYVRHEVVHNRFVVDRLRHNGAIFVNEIDEVPDLQTVIFSAHGVAKAVRETAQQRGLHVFDATCPLVTKVHMEVVRYRKDGIECILIGHAGHPEVEGTLGQVNDGIHLVETRADVDRLTLVNTTRLAYVTQTTLSVHDTARIIEALTRRFPTIKGPRQNDICYATQNRQNAVRQLAQQCDLMLVVGSPNSSNSNRLREIGQQMGIPSYLIDNADQIEPHWVGQQMTVGVTAGASAPEILVQEVIKKLQQWGADQLLEIQGSKESVTFSLPYELRQTV